MTDAEIGLLAVIAGGATLTLGLAFTNLRAEKAERGVLALELAWTQARARRILDDWRARRLIDAARADVILDFAWIVLYSAAFALLAAALSDESWPVYAALAAGVCDVGENLGLLRMLGGTIAGRLVAATSLAATLKLVLLAASLVGALAT